MSRFRIFSINEVSPEDDTSFYGSCTNGDNNLPPHIFYPPRRIIFSRARTEKTLGHFG